jgi:Holliday junction resolvase
MSKAAVEKPAQRPGRAAPRADSRAKGAAAEREFAALVLDLAGVKLVRNLEQARGGGHDLEPQGDDPAAAALRRFAIECKRYGTVTPALLAKFWQQAERQARLAGRVPVLAYRADRREWRVVLPLGAVNAEAFGAWEGIDWTCEMSAPAFCALVREGAA